MSVNGSDFPNVWPTPMRGEVLIHRGPEVVAELRLPIWSDPAPSPVELLPSKSAAASTGSGGDPPPWRVVHDVLEDRLHFVMSSGNEFVISNRNPAVAYAKARSVRSAGWEGFTARSEATCALTSDEQTFQMTISLNVFVNDALHFQKRWSRSVGRALL
jgi:hypothetical protein